MYQKDFEIFLQILQFMFALQKFRSPPPLADNDSGYFFLEEATLSVSFLAEKRYISLFLENQEHFSNLQCHIFGPNVSFVCGNNFV